MSFAFLNLRRSQSSDARSLLVKNDSFDIQMNIELIWLIDLSKFMVNGLFQLHIRTGKLLGL